MMGNFNERKEREKGKGKVVVVVVKIEMEGNKVGEEVDEEVMGFLNGVCVIIWFLVLW